MNSYHQSLRVFAAVLLCALLQYCTRDIPTPAPAPNNTTRESSLRNRSAASLAKDGIVAKKEKVKAAAQQSSRAGADSTTTSQLMVCYDYFLVYYTNGVETSREFLYTECSDNDGPSGSGSSGGGASSGGGDGNGTGAGTSGAISPTTVLVVPPDRPVNNVRQYLRCFTATQSATFTVYAAQPRSGRADTWTGSLLNPNVGHTFISITQNGITRVLGFYPTSPVALVDDAVGIIGDDGSHSYSVRITTTISPAHLNNLLTYIYSHSENTYILSSHNCTDFGIEAASAAGFYLPSTYGAWGLSGGSTPGTLGQDMRTTPLPAGATRSLSGTAPANAGGC